MRAHEDGAESSLLHANHFVAAAGASRRRRGRGSLSLLLLLLLHLRLRALQAEHVLAGNVPTVDQDRPPALFTDVYHRIHDLKFELNQLIHPIHTSIIRRVCLSTFFPMRLAVWSHCRLSIGCEGARSSVVKVGASS